MSTEDPSAMTVLSAEPPVRRRRDREASERALIAAALEVFAERGYDAATTREVAERAGVSEGLISRYFDGKAGLLVAVMKSFMESAEAENPYQNLPLKSRLDEEIKQLFAVSCGRSQEHVNFRKVAMSRAFVDPEVGQQMGANVYIHELPLLERRLALYRDHGIIPFDTDLPSLALTVLSLNYTFGFLGPEILGFEKAVLQKAAEAAAEQIARGISRPLSQ